MLAWVFANAGRHPLGAVGRATMLDQDNRKDLSRWPLGLNIEACRENIDFQRQSLCNKNHTGEPG